MGHAYLLGPGCDDATLLAGCTSSDNELLGLLRSQEYPELNGSAGPSATVATKSLSKAVGQPKSRKR
jgi:hypothetical protein